MGQNHHYYCFNKPGNISIITWTSRLIRISRPHRLGLWRRLWKDKGQFSWVFEFKYWLHSLLCLRHRGRAIRWCHLFRRYHGRKSRTIGKFRTSIRIHLRTRLITSHGARSIWLNAGRAKLCYQRVDDLLVRKRAELCMQRLPCRPRKLWRCIFEPQQLVGGLERLRWSCRVT